jgi:hypothetical protein
MLMEATNPFVRVNVPSPIVGPVLGDPSGLEASLAGFIVVSKFQVVIKEPTAKE